MKSISGMEKTAERNPDRDAVRSTGRNTDRIADRKADRSSDGNTGRRVLAGSRVPGLLPVSLLSCGLHSACLLPAALLAAFLLTGCGNRPVYMTPKDMMNLYRQGGGTGAESLSESVSEGLTGSEDISEASGISGVIDLYAAEDISETAKTLPGMSGMSGNRPGSAEKGREKRIRGRAGAGREETGKDRIRTSPGAGAASRALVPYTDGAHRLIPGWNLIVDMDLCAPAHTLSLLRYRLERLLEDYEGTWSIALRDLQTGERAVIQDIPMPSASIMKLFILGCLYEDFRTGATERTPELVQRMNDMIRASSNSAANEIIRILGKGDYAAGIRHINEYIREAGYSKDTQIHNPFQEESLILDPEHHNQTSAEDTAELLERVYRRSFAVRYACNETEQMLLESETKYKLPSVLPEGISAANKTGETDEVENDAAIIFTPGGDYILCVFSTDWTDKGAAQQHFKEISAEAYRYFSSDDYGKKLYPYLREAPEPKPLPYNE